MTPGTGYPIAYNIVFHCLNKLSMTLDYEEVFDPKSRIKEVYDNLRWTDSKWDINKEMKTTENKSDRTWETVIYGYLYGDQVRNPTRRGIVGRGVGINIKKSQNMASEDALRTLQRHGIHEVRPDPFKKN